MVFMGRQRNASCSSGGNRTRGSQPAGSERNAWSCSSGGLGRNKRWKRGLAYRKRRKRTSYGRNGGHVDREGCGVLQNGTPWDTVHLHRRPPPASTGSCSPSLHCALLHRLLFNHPSTVYCSSSPPHHRVLFIQRQCHSSLFIQPPPQRSLFIQSIGFS